MSAVALILVLLGATAAVRVLAERFDIPHPALLVLGGLALAVTPGLPRACPASIGRTMPARAGPR